MDDLISRQAAIDIERNATVDTNPMHFEAYQKFTQFMDDAEISSFGRWQWSNGFNTALTAVGIDLKKLPSAQPHWIPCSERLPKEKQDVLLAFKHNMVVGFWEDILNDGSQAWYANSGNGWMTGTETVDDDGCPLAWMPLPDPYKGE